MYKIKVHVYLKENILDPQGKAVTNALHQLGFNEVQTVRVGKYFQLFTDNVEDLEGRIKSMCQKLLVNEVIEDVDFTIENAA
jgi:phosphoribosylformylglycinamidine synthase subunit PurS